MQRHFSDTHALFSTLALAQQQQQHAPLHPSRLNPALSGKRGNVPAALLGRGTVSMPSSPLIRAVALPWAEPNSAHAAFDAMSGTSTDFGASDYLHTTIDPLFTLPGAQVLAEHAGYARTDPFHLTSPTFFDQPDDRGMQLALSLSASQSPRAPLIEHEAQRSVSFVKPTVAEADEPEHQVGHRKERYAAYDEVSRLGHSSHDRDQAEYPYGEGGELEDQYSDLPARKKRHQVRVACTHCQKACKKCSNTRPCERCVKYGLPDCLDSARKPRRSGDKRGPYKRRMPRVSGEGAYREFSPDSPVLNGRLDIDDSRWRDTSAGGPNDGSQRYRSYPAQESTGTLHDNAWFPAQSLGQVTHDHPARPARTEEVSLAHNLPPATATAAAQHHPSFSDAYPPPAPLGSALSAALNGLSARPTWIDGQRVLRGLAGDVSLGVAGTLMPHTPTVPFPLSLRGGEDPFSRAVSPIRSSVPGLIPGASSADPAWGPGDSYSATNATLGTIQEVDSRPDTGSAVQTTCDSSRPATPAPVGRSYANIPNGASQKEQIGTPLNEGMAAFFSGHKAAGRDTTTTTAAALAGHQTSQASQPFRFSLPSQDEVIEQITSRSPMTERELTEGSIPPAGAHIVAPFFGTVEPTRAVRGAAMTQTEWGYHALATIPLKRIRKPSLRTLMVPGISREGSPVGGWSPGLTLALPRMQLQMSGSGAEPGQGQGGRVGGNDQSAYGLGQGNGTMSPTLFQGELGEEGEVWAL